MTSMSNAALVCPACGSSSIRRSRQQNVTEWSRMALGTYPFRCVPCNHRFWANIWLWPVLRYAKCPRCLSLNLTTWEHKVQHLSYWKKLLLTLGAKRHRCARCRCNFVSLRPHSPLVGSGATPVALDEPVPTVD